MSMPISVARMRIARELHDAELKLDDALIGQASLLATLVIARRETDSQPFEGHATLLRLHKAQQALLTAGGELARVHTGLTNIQVEKGILERCPPNEPTALIDDLAKAG